MIKIKNYIILLIAIVIGFVACESMDDNFNQYMEETIYPGKVEGLSISLGLERIYVNWISPKDPKSKNIVVKYGKTDSLIMDVATNSVAISGLTSGGGYDIEVYSMDQYGNASVKSYASAMPVSQDWIDANLVVPTPQVAPSDGVHPDSLDFNWFGLTNSVMQYTGEMSYSLKMGGVEIENGVAGGAQWEQGNENITLKNLELNSNYSLEYDIRLIPRVNEQNILDTATVRLEYNFTPVDYKLPPIFMLLESNGWDESSFIQLDAVSEGIYKSSLDLKHGDVLRFFGTPSLDAEKQYGYSAFLPEKIQLMESTDDGSYNLAFTHSDGTYIVTVDLAGKSVSVEGTVEPAYLGLPGLIPGIVECELFDEGGNNVAYYDNSSRHANSSFRIDEDVDIYNSGNSEHPYIIAYTAGGEWLNYTVDVLETGTYNMSVFLAAPATQGAIVLSIDGTEIGRYTPASTGAWGSYEMQTIGEVTLTKGRHLLRWDLENAKWNVNYFEFTKAD